MLLYPEIDPAILSIGPFQLRWYSLMYVIGLFSIYITFKRAVARSRLSLTPDQIESVMIIGLLGMIVGARLAYVLIYNFSHFMQHPTEIPEVWRGGLSFHGAFAGIAVAILIYCRANRISYFSVTDHICTAAPIGLGLGRIGNFINGELWGRVTDVPWAMIFPDGGPLPRHPSQLYEAFLEGLLLFVVMAVLYTAKPKPGILTGTFVMTYAVFRFFVEFFREPDLQLGSVMGPFTMGQLLCVLMGALGCFITLSAVSRNDG